MWFFHRNKYYLVRVLCVSFGPWIAEIYGEWHWANINETLVIEFTKFIDSIFILFTWMTSLPGARRNSSVAISSELNFAKFSKIHRHLSPIHFLLHFYVIMFGLKIAKWPILANSCRHLTLQFHPFGEISPNMVTLPTTRSRNA